MSLTNRYDFVVLFDVKDGNPNGDPDAGNLPRTDAETGQGLVTDVCIKRKIRNFVSLAKAAVPGYSIFVSEGAVLNSLIAKAYEQPEVIAKEGKSDKQDTARDYMCRSYFDIRTFGAVMSTGGKDVGNAGQVRGPVQLTFARSIDPIIVQEHTITRMAVTSEKDAEKERTMGRKHTVPYGLYRAHGFVSSFLAKQTGFSDEDLSLLWQSIYQMFDHDRSAARGEMSVRGLYVFKHDSDLGNAPAHELFARIAPKLKSGVSAPRAFSDYEVHVDDSNLPSGVGLLQK